jgi:hypothetical protein
MSDRRTRNKPILSRRRVLRDDRRGAPRYITRGTPAVLGWAEGNNQFRTTSATLIDMSMGGCSAWVANFPPPGTAIWLRLDGARPSPWLKAGVVARIKSGYLFWSRRRVRLRFLESCTYDLFKRAIGGFTHESYFRDQPVEGFDGRYWR